MAEPSDPDVEAREHLLDVLGEFVARGGAAPLPRTDHAGRIMKIPGDR